MTLDLSGVDLTTEVVRSRRLVLRPHRPGDVDAFVRACQDPEIQRWIHTLPMPYTAAAAREFVIRIAPADRAERRGMPVVVEADGGVVGAAKVDLHRGVLGPEIGYWMAPWARGRGYASEATDALAAWAFGRGAARVHLLADVANTASHAVARRAGFCREGVVRACLEYRDGTRADAALFGRVR